MSIFRNDLGRLVRNPLALIVILLTIVLASALAWCSVAALWAPQENAANVKIAVVNKDAGFESKDAGKVDVGASIVDAVRGNRQFAWDVVDANTGDAGLQSGEYYATIVVPENFSESFSKFLSGEAEQPVVEYWVNQKYDPAAFEITDASAAVVDTAIGKAFSDLITGAAPTEAAAAAESEESSDKADSRAEKNLNTANGKIKKAAKSFESVQKSIDEWRETVKSAQTSLDELQQSLPDVRNGIADSTKMLSDTRSAIHAINGSYGSILSDSGSQATANAEQVAQTVNAALANMDDVETNVDAILEQAEATLEYNRDVIAALGELEDPPGNVADILDKLETSTDALEEAIDDMVEVKATISDSVDGAAADADQAQTAEEDTNKAIEGLDSAGLTFVQDVMPKLETSIDTLALALGSLSGSVDGLDAQIGQSKKLLEELDSVFAQAKDVLDKTEDSLTVARSSLESARTSLAAVADSEFMKQAAEISGADAASFAKFMSAPVSATVEDVYPANSYGAMVAPYYTCLALWLGVLMLVFLIKLEVDSSRFPHMRARHAFGGRLLLLVLLSAVLGAVACAGDMLFGVEVAHPIAFIAAGAVTAIAFACIVLSLAFVFRHVGKALAVVLLVVQVPLASGIYPADLMPGVFKGLHALMPFTYGIGALREAAGGFYDGYFATNMLALAVMAVGAVVFALIVLPHALNVARMFDRKLGRADVFCVEGLDEGDDVRDSLSAMRAMLADGAQRDEVIWQAWSFDRVYRRLKVVIPIVIVVLPIAMIALMALFQGDINVKITLLLAFLAVLVALFAAVVAVEHTHDNLNQQLRLARVSQGEARASVSGRGRHSVEGR